MKAVGSLPVLAVGFPSDLALHVPANMGIVPTSQGWPVKIAWVERRSYGRIVTIRAWLRPQRQPVWFSSHTQGPQPYLRLDPRGSVLYPPIPDPRHPGRVLANPDWKGFSSVIYLPRAACYVMEASWPGGTWRVRFTAGQ